MPEPRLRICFIITGLGIGGAEHALLRLLSCFDTTRFDMSLIVLGCEDALVERFLEIGIRPTMLRLTPGRWPLGEIGRFLQAVRRTKPDVIQGWMYHGNFAASFAAARLKTSVPVCWSVRDTPDAAHNHSRFTRMVIRLSNWYVPRVEKIFNVSASSAAYCSEHLGWPLARTEVLPNGIDTLRFAPDPLVRAATRAALNVSPHQYLIGMVARWTPVKNHALFLEAATDFRKQQPSAVFALVGKGLDAGNTALMAQIEGLGLGDAVRLLGPRADVEKIYPALDLLALTSKSEGFPNVLAEAMSCGVAVVSTDVGDARDIVGNGGRIVAATAQAFGAVFVDLLDADKRLRIGQTARDRIRQRYALEEVAARLQRSYKALLVAWQARKKSEENERLAQIAKNKKP